MVIIFIDVYFSTELRLNYVRKSPGDIEFIQKLMWKVKIIFNVIVIPLVKLRKSSWTVLCIERLL